MAYLAIAAFLAMLVLLLLRTMFMLGSVMLLNFFKRRGKESADPTSHS